MLQVTDDGANITLSGKASGSGNGLFWFATALLIGAVGVAMAMSILSERLAIGALALLIIGSFIFNKMKVGSKTSSTKAVHIHAGVLRVQHGMFAHSTSDKRQQVVIAMGDEISVIDDNQAQLTVSDASGKLKCQVSGFESAKEAKVMKAILLGQQFGKRRANIKMQSTS